MKLGILRFAEVNLTMPLFALETEPRLNHEWFDEVMKSNIPL